MSEVIQRVPRGLADLLSIFGGRQPTKLGEEVIGVLELIQLYGLTQLQTAQNFNVALAEGSTVELTPSASAWTVLFGVQGVVAKTATMTAARASVHMNRRTTNTALLFADELGPFAATETGNASFGGRLPYPTMMPPGSTVGVRLDILGTDANAVVTVIAEFGVLG